MGTSGEGLAVLYYRGAHPATTGRALKSAGAATKGPGCGKQMFKCPTARMRLEFRAAFLGMGKTIAVIAVQPEFLGVHEGLSEKVQGAIAPAMDQVRSIAC